MVATEPTPGGTLPRRELSRKTVAGYALGSLGTGGFATLPGIVLVFFLTDTLGVAALAAGLVVTVAKIWDVIIDPVIGSRSDRSLLNTGSRRRYMVLGSVLLPVFFILTFAVPAGLDPAVSALWVLIAFVLTATAFSLFQVPYIALPAEIASGYDQRTRLLTWRVVVLTVAIPEETQVPSTNEFATFYRINPATAGKGVNLLVDAGILYKKRGIGMFVAEGSRATIVANRRDQFQTEYVRPLVAEAAKLGISQVQLAEMIQKEGTA